VNFYKVEASLDCLSQYFLIDNFTILSFPIAKAGLYQLSYEHDRDLVAKDWTYQFTEIDACWQQVWADCLADTGAHSNLLKAYHASVVFVSTVCSSHVSRALTAINFWATSMGLFVILIRRVISKYSTPVVGLNPKAEMV